MPIQYDSRAIQAGDIFLAMPGLTVDGRAYMQQALDAGASKIYYEQSGCEQFTLPDTEVLLIAVSDLQQQAGHIAAAFYDHPSQKINMIGVTGTNGKTSVTYFLAQCLEQAAILGTTGYGDIAALQASVFTTPMATDVQRILYELVDQGYQHVAMEVSSHALVQHRVEAVDFDIAVFTNLSRDHLDYHPSMEDYAEAKWQLFTVPSVRYAIFNIDDPVGAQFAQRRLQSSVLTYAIEKPADICVKQLQIVADGYRCKVLTPWGEAQIHIPLIGCFNILNALATIAVMGIRGIPLDEIAEKISMLKPPPGRMQTIKKPDRPLVVIDYAHTPDALLQALQALREHCQGQLFCVFGCGGDRDTGKRELMGQVASNYADVIIITNDNPRTEDPQQIADMICQGANDKATILLDRRTAIEYAIAEAQPQDCVLIAGKGHEDYQIIGSETRPFSDNKIVSDFISL